MTVLTLTVGAPAAGGSCVAHTDEATVFVRGALPGETVRATVVGSIKSGRILFARTTEVMTPSEFRVTPPCPVANRCGGCDLQHVHPAEQAEWKASVLRDQLMRIGGTTDIAGEPMATAVTVLVVPVAGAEPGLGWRSRATIHANASGAPGFYAYRSREVVPTTHCPVLVPALQPALAHRWPGGAQVSIAASSDRVTAVGDVGRSGVPAGWSSRAWLEQAAVGRTWRVASDGFWQSHVEAPAVLTAAVRQVLVPRAGDRLLDLYSGVGLFAGALAEDVGITGRIDAVEVDTTAARLARRNLHDCPQVQLHNADVRQFLAERTTAQPGEVADLVVLDPPRAGAGAATVRLLTQTGARAIAYVACDGAALARDVRTFAELGWHLATVQGFDLYPMSHHTEAVALFTPDNAEATGRAVG